MAIVAFQISNPSKWERSSFVKITFQNQELYQNHQIYSETNEEISSQIDKNSKNEVVYSFVAENIPALAFQTFYLKPRDRTASFHLPQEGLLDGNDFYLENDAMRAVLEENGTLTIMHRNSEPENVEGEEKLYAMGEELVKGSIWAADSFFNCRGLNQLVINSHPLVPPKKSHLLEASDFKGNIQLEYHIPKDLTSEWIYRPSFSIDKGESPVLLITLPGPTELANLQFEVMFNLSFEISKKIEEENHVVLWDDGVLRGLVIMHPGIRDIIQYHPENNKQFTLDFSKRFVDNPETALKYALIPINADCLVDGSIDGDYVGKYVFDYYNPFEYKILK
ncbi:MAG: hypothetical protein ACTSRK_02725 [Promethearchaeota archaeon]